MGEAGIQMESSARDDDGELHYHHLHCSSRDDDVTLALLTRLMAQFASERDWDKFHSPRNLLLALVGEVGEVSEIFQWKGEVPKGLPDWSEDEKERLGEELSDVLLYLVRLADICQINLGAATLKKLEKNALKYPVARCKGSSLKYTAYQNEEVEAGHKV